MVDRAITTLLAAAPGEVRLDRTTARLIGDRFVVDEAGDDRRLLAERPLEDMPTLLGRPSPMVGRQRELTMLLATFTECVESNVARGILVTAPAGQGKSRLRHELLRELVRQRSDLTVLLGRGEPLSAGSPFVMLSPALRRHAGIDEADPAELMQRKLLDGVGAVMPGPTAHETAAFLGELARVPFPDNDLPALRAARSEPTLLAEQTRTALCRFLAAACRQRPVLLVLDDLHWGDQPSVTYVDALLRELEHQPFMVLAFARPEVHDLFPRLWEGRDVEQLRLRPLAHKAAVELVRHALGAEPSDAQVESLAARSEGNPFFLEELVQATAEGDHDLPDSVLAVVQARLRALPDEARRLLLAASVFGEVFWARGAATLLDDDAAFDPTEWLGELSRRELILAEPRSTLAGHDAYRFRHALVRDGAYAMLLDADVVAAHRRAAAWLVAAGERDPLVLAGHFVAAAQPDQAIEYFTLAAQQALAASDMHAAIERAERAVAIGARGAALGRLREIQASACFWSGRYAEAVRFGRETADLLDEGGGAWYRAVGVASAAAARHNDFAAQEALFRRAERASGHGAERIICLCRVAYQLCWQGQWADADRAIALIGDPTSADALPRAHVAELISLRHLVVGDLGLSLRPARDALDAFIAAGDANNALLMRFHHVYVNGRFGLYEPVAALRSLVEAAAGRRAIELVGMQAVGVTLMETGGDLEEAEHLLGSSLAVCRASGSVRMHGWATLWLAQLSLKKGAAAEAQTRAREASQLLIGQPVLRGHAIAVEARALAGLGRFAEARQLAIQAFELAERLGGLMTGELMPGLVAGELHDRCGDHEAARRTIRQARAWILTRVSRIADPQLRASYLALPDAARTLELASAWLPDEEPRLA